MILFSEQRFVPLRISAVQRELHTIILPVAPGNSPFKGFAELSAKKTGNKLLDLLLRNNFSLFSFIATVSAIVIYKHPYIKSKNKL